MIHCYATININIMCATMLLDLAGSSSLQVAIATYHKVLDMNERL